MRQDSKICIFCGRIFHSRRKWKHSWSKVTYCSKGCRNWDRSGARSRVDELVLAAIGAAYLKVGTLSDELQGHYPDVDKFEVHASVRRLCHEGTLRVIDGNGKRCAAEVDSSSSVARCTQPTPRVEKPS